MGLLPSRGQVQRPRPQNTHTLLCGTQLWRLGVQQLAAGPAQEHPSAYSFRTFLGSPRTLLGENATQTLEGRWTLPQGPGRHRTPHRRQGLSERALRSSSPGHDEAGLRFRDVLPHSSPAPPWTVLRGFRGKGL